MDREKEKVKPGDWVSHIDGEGLVLKVRIGNFEKKEVILYNVNGTWRTKVDKIHLSQKQIVDKLHELIEKNSETGPINSRKALELGMAYGQIITKRMYSEVISKKVREKTGNI